MYLLYFKCVLQVQTHRQHQLPWAYVFKTHTSNLMLVITDLRIEEKTKYAFINSPILLTHRIQKSVCVVFPFEWLIPF